MTAPAPLSVVLQMDEGMHSALQRDAGALESAKAFTIDSHEMAALANTDLQEVKARLLVVKQWKGKFVEPAKQIIANAEALFDPAIERLAAAEAYHKQNIAGWTTDQKRLADEQMRAQQAEERRVRQEAEQKAAKARARAEEQAREQQRIAAEAERARAQAAAEGNAREASRQAGLAAKASEAAAAAVETGNAKASEALLSAAATVNQYNMPQVAKLDGFSTASNWKGELAPDVTEEQALERIVAAIAGVALPLTGRTDLLALLKRDTSACDKLAKAQKKLMNVPGMVAKDRPTSRSKAA